MFKEVDLNEWAAYMLHKLHISPAAGIDLCQELDVEATIGSFDPAEKAQRQEALADAAWQAVQGAYQALEGAIHSGDQLQKDCYSQPWRQ